MLDVSVDIKKMMYGCYNYYVLKLFFITKLECYKISKLVTKNLIE